MCRCCAFCTLKPGLCACPLCAIVKTCQHAASFSLLFRGTKGCTIKPTGFGLSFSPMDIHGQCCKTVFEPSEVARGASESIAAGSLKLGGSNLKGGPFEVHDQSTRYMLSTTAG